MLRDIHNRFVADDGFPLAGNIAFSSLLALFPFLIFLTSLAGFLGNEALAQTVVDYLLSVAPEELVNPFKDDIHSILTVPTPGVLTISIFLTLLMAANGVESIRTALNRAYGYRQTDRRLWIFRKTQNLAFVLGGSFVLLALAALIVFGPMGWDWAEARINLLVHFSRWFHLLRYPVGLGLLFLALLCGHLFLPARRQPIRKVLPGILITVLLWLLAAWGYGEYTARFSRAHAMYAGLGNIVIALVFVYISALVVILGGEINQALLMRHEKNKEINLDKK